MVHISAERKCLGGKNQVCEIRSADVFLFVCEHSELVCGDVSPPVLPFATSLDCEDVRILVVRDDLLGQPGNRTVASIDLFVEAVGVFNYSAGSPFGVALSRPDFGL